MGRTLGSGWGFVDSGRGWGMSMTVRVVGGLFGGVWVNFRDSGHGLWYCCAYWVMVLLWLLGDGRVYRYLVFLWLLGDR